ncbi:hypothetical protein Pmani_021171 [Petrolisthes manimaculis]|uniref:Uncharacterized protein n=1 Tax=Petrolisthes manimaculis TaxID=1843537 RepID=A0AAE1U3H9_9EUCA|nr:hypothetical protein Pmani_021171 [Petrolisthes manimaculis]
MNRTWDCSTRINSAWLRMALVGCAVFITAGINSGSASRCKHCSCIICLTWSGEIGMELQYPVRRVKYSSLYLLPFSIHKQFTTS